jgi:hypothetical protein
MRLVQVRRSRRSVIKLVAANITKWLSTGEALHLLKHCTNTPARNDKQGRCAECRDKALMGDTEGK